MSYMFVYEVNHFIMDQVYKESMDQSDIPLLSTCANESFQKISLFIERLTYNFAGNAFEYLRTANVHIRMHLYLAEIP